MSTRKPAAGLRAAITAGQSTAPLEASFAEVVALIEQAQQLGFTRRNLFRMRQFYETYRNEAKVTPLVTQLPWTHNMVILMQSKRPEREPGHRVAAVRQQGQRSGRVRAEPHAVAGADRRVPDPTARQATARGQAPRVLRAERPGAGERQTCERAGKANEESAERGARQ